MSVQQGLDAVAGSSPGTIGLFRRIRQHTRSRIDSKGQGQSYRYYCQKRAARCQPRSKRDPMPHRPPTSPTNNNFNI